MTSDPHMQPLNDDQLFDLLEHPEQWPEDPALQAHLAELLEVHLGLHAHADDLDAALRKEGSAPWWRSGLLSAATLLLLVGLPTAYAVLHARSQAEQRQNREHIENVARRRGQDRIWSMFLTQSGALLRDFEGTPHPCARLQEREDRTAQQQLALALKTRSQMLIGAEAPSREAKEVIENLHAWLQEVSLEDGCMPPERVQELRQLAKGYNLPEEVERVNRLLGRVAP